MDAYRYLADLQRSFSSYPGCYDFLAKERSHQTDDYPAYCYLHTDAAFNYLGSRCCMELTAAGSLAPGLTACFTWRSFRRIYEYDPDMASSLTEPLQELDESSVLPLEALQHLPFPCIYVAAPDVVAEGFHGFFAYLEPSEDPQVPYLVAVFCLSGSTSFVTGRLRLDPGKPIGECVPDADLMMLPVISSAAKGDPAALELALGHIKAGPPMGHPFQNMVLRAAQLLLYIVSANADIAQDAPVREEAVASPAKKAAQKDPFEPPEDVFYNKVGFSTGAKIREARAAAGSGKSVRAHMRKGHWHKYWTGPKNGERKLVPRWVDPVFVGKGEADPDVSVTKIARKP